MNFQNEDTIAALGAGVLQPGQHVDDIHACKYRGKP